MINDLVAALAEAEQNLEDAETEQLREYWAGKVYEIEQILDYQTSKGE